MRKFDREAKRANKRFEADSLRRRFAPTSLAAQAFRYVAQRIAR